VHYLWAGDHDLAVLVLELRFLSGEPLAPRQGEGNQDQEDGRDRWNLHRVVRSLIAIQGAHNTDDFNNTIVGGAKEERDYICDSWYGVVRYDEPPEKRTECIGPHSQSHLL